MTKTYNIPSLSAGKVINLLSKLYIQAYKNCMMSNIPSVSLIGPMGVGKSTLVREVAKRLEQSTTKKVNVVDIRLLNFTPIDLRGIPTHDLEKKFTVWLKPQIFNLKEDEINIILLDELYSAPQSIQAAAYQIALDKQIGEHKLPKDCIVIAAGNRTIDKSVVYRMPKALANRMLHFEIHADFSSWYEWASEKEIDPRVIGYLSFDHSKLCMDPTTEELAFPTPRSWEFVSNILKTSSVDLRENLEDMHELICGCIGIKAATEFEAWCFAYRNLPSTEDIVSGKYTKPVRGADVTYALISSLLHYLMNHKEDISEAELANVCRYISRFSSDFAMLFYRGALKIEGMNLKFMMDATFKNWMKNNKRYL